MTENKCVCGHNKKYHEMVYGIEYCNICKKECKFQLVSQSKVKKCKLTRKEKEQGILDDCDECMAWRIKHLPSYQHPVPREDGKPKRVQVRKDRLDVSSSNQEFQLRSVENQEKKDFLDKRNSHSQEPRKPQPSGLHGESKSVRALGDDGSNQLGNSSNTISSLMPFNTDYIGKRFNNGKWRMNEQWYHADEVDKLLKVLKKELCLQNDKSEEGYIKDCPCSNCGLINKHFGDLK